MHGVDAAGRELGGAAAAAVHVDDLGLDSVRRIEAGGIRHPDRQHGVDRIGDADFELDGLRGHRGDPQQWQEQDDDGEANQPAPPLRCMHVGLPKSARSR
jgi:hypothetical protein